MAVKQRVTVRKDADRRRAGKIPKWREEDFRAIVSINADAMIVVDNEGFVLYVNPAAESLFSLPSAEMVGASFGFPLILDEPVELYVLRQFKDYVAVEMRVVNVLWAGEPSYLLSFHDVTGRIINEQDLIHARDKDEEALHESEQRFHDLADNIPNLAWMANPDGWIFWYNRQWYDYTGTTLEEMQGWGWQKVHHPDYVKAVTEEWGSSIRAGQPYDSVFPLRGKDGNYRWFLTRVTPIRDEQGNIQRWFGTNTDITERKQAEEALRISEASLAEAQQIAHLCNWEWNLTTNEVIGSEELYRMFGLTHDTTTFFDQYTDRLAPEDRQRVVEALDNTAKNGVPYNIEYRVILPDGTDRFIHAKAVISYDGDKPAKIFGIAQDITERKQAEEAVRNSERLYRAIGESIDYGVWVCAPDGRNIYASESFLKLVGMTQPQISDFGWGDVLHPDDAERTIAAWKECVRTGGAWDIEHRYLGVDGKYHPILARGVPVRDDQGKVISWAGINLDISGIKRTEEALKAAKMQAELYVDLMGHDINNMNHGAMGYLELALETLETEKRLKLDDKLLIEKPKNIMASSSALINNVRKLQQLTSEGVKTKPTDLHKIFRELETTSLHIDDREVLINIQQLPDIMVEANELLKDVFLNLITNAIKHSDIEKSLTVNVTVEPVNENGQKYYRCIVEDNGPGIPDELKGKLFNRFQRGATKAHGKGLGLYLVRTLVEGYHGKVWVEDRVPGDHKKGSRFVVVLPAA